MRTLPAGFTHLNTHSYFSLLAATAAPEALVAQATADGFTALALTDRDALYGAVVFSRACEKAGLQPILGMTVPLALPPDRLGPAAVPGDRLTLLAQDGVGYRTLCRLASWLQGAPDRETRLARGLPLTLLGEETDGLLCFAGGTAGRMAAQLRAGREEGAQQYAAALARLFPGRFYLALPPVAGSAGDRVPTRALQAALAGIGQRLGLPLVAVQPIHCLQAAERSRLRLLAALSANCRLEAVRDEALPGGAEMARPVHWPDKAATVDAYADYPEALMTVASVVGRCRPALPDGRPIWPVLQLPAGQTAAAALRAQAAAGCERHFGQSAPAVARLARELAVITAHGYAELFLIVADVVRFARAVAVPVSTRGSVANSLVAYCLGITTVDPLAHDLLFERFLNPARANPPDIDLDFCSRRRDEVLAYIRRTYGAEKVALVATVSTLQAKSAVRETAKAYGLVEKQIKALTRRLPRRWHPDPRRRDRRTAADVIAELTDPVEREVVRQAFELVGQPHHLSVHPGGVVITPGPLTDVVPLQWAPKGFLITQYDHVDVEAIGLQKIDLLGIRALTVLAETVDQIRARHDPSFDLAAIPGDDEATGDLLASGGSIGVFQCESAGAQRTLRQLRARAVADLAVANAFFKPGPATGGMYHAFIRRYRGQEPVSFLHPALVPILRPTQGVLLFQEQILRIARDVAGLSWDEADHLRRGMSKFQKAEMAAMRDRFVAGCCQPVPAGPAFTPAQADTLWGQVLAFAGYGFNQGHATAYADVSYRSAYLKAHWPAEFMWARLAVAGGYHNSVIYLAEARRLGLLVRPPHINHSRRRITLAYEPAGQPVLWLGLGQVRDLRRRTIMAIIKGRPFANLADLTQRVKVQAKELIHLIQAGALDGLGPSRAALLAQAKPALQAGSSGQLRFDFAAPPTPVPEDAGQRLIWEQALLGQPVSVDPLHFLPDSARAGTLSLADLVAAPGQIGAIAAFRLPGWTGDKGFFVSDWHLYVIAHFSADRPAPPSWAPFRLEARWQLDEWGGGKLVVSDLAALSP